MNSSSSPQILLCYVSQRLCWKCCRSCGYWLSRRFIITVYCSSDFLLSVSVHLKRWYKIFLCVCCFYSICFSHCRPFMCWCAVKKLLTHPSLPHWSCRQLIQSARTMN